MNQCYKFDIIFNQTDEIHPKIVMWYNYIEIQRNPFTFCSKTYPYTFTKELSFTKFKISVNRSKWTQKYKQVVIMCKQLTVFTLI